MPVDASLPRSRYAFQHKARPFGPPRVSRATERFRQPSGRMPVTSSPISQPPAEDSRTPWLPDADPIGVLTSTWPVVAQAAWVTIDRERVAALAEDLVERQAEPEPWASQFHYRDPADPDRTAMWVFVLDTLNFCFWSERPDPDDRWRVAYRGEVSMATGRWRRA